MSGFVVTIDGPAGAGKSSTARGVAEKLGYRFLDTGALYRALALAVLRSGVDDPIGTEALEVCRSVSIRPVWEGSGMGVLLDGEDVSGEIRSPRVTDLVSPLSANAAVRELLIRLQRGAARSGGIVVEGRDIGSVVFPDAPVKVFLTAHVDERTRRRVRQLKAAGVEADLDEVRRRIEERDRRDSERDVAPLVRPDDAFDLDTTGITLDEQIGIIVRLVREAGG